MEALLFELSNNQYCVEWTFLLQLYHMSEDEGMSLYVEVMLLLLVVASEQ